MSSNVLFTGKTHTTNGRDGAAWSACSMGVIEFAASRREIKLPDVAAVDAEIKLNLDGASFFLTARFDVSLPELDREVGQALIQAAHEICPYSKAARGNIAVVTHLV